MQIIRDVRPPPKSARGCVVALGNFDGLHPGHLAVLAQCREIARAEGRRCAVLTFEPHPREFFRPDAPSLRLMTFAEKAAGLRDLGVELLFVARFNAALAQMEARDFIETVLMHGLRAAHIVTGEDFGFGRGRGGSPALLADYAREGAFGYTHLTHALNQGGEKISSTHIREHLAAGEPEKAALLLGHPFALSGRVIHGDARGRALGFPTANMRLANRFLPKFGVYAVRGHWKGRVLPGAASLGIRPMFEVKTPLLESYFFGFSETLYGDSMRVELLHYLRPEARFADVDALAAQMRADCETARGRLAL
jgi:riboflavin kinase/FMN adenylyltransferase